MANDSKELKILKGTFDVSRETKNPADITTGIPLMPDYLTEYAKQKWTDLTNNLLAMKVLSLHDGDALVAYCESYSKWRHALEQFKELDCQHIIDGKINPISKILNDVETNYMRWIVRFGLTPVDRPSLEKITTTPGNKFGRFKK